MGNPDSNTKPSMLTDPVWKSLVFFAVPLLLGSIFQQLYNTAGVFFCKWCDSIGGMEILRVCSC